ncbi:DoxX family protein [Spongiivirga sp. MCCC 1A20706]|uniref:DoxX family protein n=1 Tax=Spongiivirga sp. MCCC 1A20706 TaxID=3160963 RepID=UPI003977AF53
MSILLFLVILSSSSFLFFGISCFFSSYMKKEFFRYGLPKWRSTVGTLQLLGSIGLFIGYLYIPVLGIIASGGLVILMMLGFAVRLMIKDSLLQSAPSLLYAVLNAFILMIILQNNATI